MTYQVLKIEDYRANTHFVAIYDTRKTYAPYTLYLVWHMNGKHRRKIAECSELKHVIRIIEDIMSGTISPDHLI